MGRRGRKLTRKDRRRRVAGLGIGEVGFEGPQGLLAVVGRLGWKGLMFVVRIGLMGERRVELWLTGLAGRTGVEERVVVEYIVVGNTAGKQLEHLMRFLGCKVCCYCSEKQGSAP